MPGQYVFEKTIEFPNMIAKIYRPVITEEERKRRMRKIEKATQNLFMGVKK